MAKKWVSENRMRIISWFVCSLHQKDTLYPQICHLGNIIVIWVIHLPVYFGLKPWLVEPNLGLVADVFLGNEQLQQLSSYCIKLAMTDACAHIFRIELVIQINREVEDLTNILSCPVNPMQCLDDPDHFPGSRQYILYFFNSIMQQRIKILILLYLPIFLAHSSSHHAMCIYQSTFQPSSKISLFLSFNFVSCPPWILGRLLQKMSKVSVSLGHPLALIHAYVNILWGHTYAVERYLN